MRPQDTRPRKSFAGKGIFPAKYAFTLLFPLRNIFLSPRQLLERVDIREDQMVLEIGPGPGYFSTHVARRLTRGRLVLLDIQQEMLDHARRRLGKRKLLNVDYLLTDGVRPDLPENRFDRVFMVTVLGEIANKSAYLEAIHQALGADGLLSISELAGDPDRLSVAELEALVCPHGFEVAGRFGSRRNYTVNFRKKATSP